MSVNFLATRTKHTLEGRRRRGNLSSPYGETRILRRATVAVDYLAGMSSGDGVESRDEAFMRWATQTFIDLKARKVSRTAAAEAGGISRNQTYQWEGRGKKGYSRPMAEKLKEFCIANNLDWRVPFGIFGWDTSGQKYVAPPEESELVKRIRLIERALEQPGIVPERRRELELMLVAARRMLDPVWDELEEEFRRQA
jgi:transcriptional regulator with XRE-family HTH domain